jgi:ectoine hydroxylase-related dioxygenase (phytanoyl-CoA dioxygenase family)
VLTKEQIRSYRELGYVAVENVLSQAQIEEGRRIVEEFVEQSRAVTANNDVFDLEPQHTAEQPMVRRLKFPDRIHPFFDELMRSDAILDRVEDLIGPNIRFQASKLNLKAAGGGSPVEWHQDFAFYPHTNDDLLAVGVYFDDTATDNGCMLMIPGSHRGPVLDHHQDGFFIGAITPSRNEVDLKRAVPIEVKAGGLSFHHVHMLHGSAPNRSNRPRRLLLYQYAAVDAWPLSGVPDLDAFNRKIVRGEPTVAMRLAPVSVRVPMPGPPGEFGSIYALQTLVREKGFADK